MDIPDIVFIVPYRDRKVEYTVFNYIMPDIINHLNYYIFFIHQNDKRLFNRGAIKNIGFLYVKKKWPKEYKNITLVFNDIDCISYYKNQFIYKTKKNIIKHHFGFKNTLGGIFSILASDFEKINGFPNIWTWGLEDNILLKRSKLFNIEVDYSSFISINNLKNIIYFNNDPNRYINKNIQYKYDTNSNTDGLNCIKNIKLGKITMIKDKIYMVNIDYFKTNENYKIYLKNTKKILPVRSFKKKSFNYNKLVFN